ncbi:unnamed protein product [Clonostachys rosea]|uniref:Uncharacterized protein n=1 Tax=Bionectria ochroleuca TaxID=29856 RepID=A0ABY6UZ03_BIOOC|nr:unnamed protein product [Clonostachys rosea]
MLFLPIWAALSATLVVAIPPISSEQVHLGDTGKTSSTEIGDGPFSHNNVTLGPVPKAEQIYETDDLDITPFPIIPNRHTYILVSGRLPSPRTSGIRDLEAALTKATLNITLSRVRSDGKIDDPGSEVMPLKAFRDNAGVGQLAIRHTNGTYVDYLPGTGDSEVLAEFTIPGMYVVTGQYKFDIVARLGDENNTCLVAFSHTQWLEGTWG